MKPCVFIHTNHKQYLGALVSMHSMRRNSRHADEFDVPILLFHGSGDRTVPVTVSDRFAAGARSGAHAGSAADGTGEDQDGVDGDAGVDRAQQEGDRVGPGPGLV